MPTPKLCSYHGQFDVAGGNLELHAERLIPKGDEVSFRFNGSNQYGDFTIESTAKNVRNIYVAVNVPITYTHFNRSDYATIEFTSLKQSQQPPPLCRISGLWIQNDCSLVFEGELDPFGTNHSEFLWFCGDDLEQYDSSYIQTRKNARAAPVHRPTKKEVEATKRKLKQQARKSAEKESADAKLKTYAKKSNKKKSPGSKASKRDVFSKASRIPGSAFSRRG